MKMKRHYKNEKSFISDSQVPRTNVSNQTLDFNALANLKSKEIES